MVLIISAVFILTLALLIMYTAVSKDSEEAQPKTQVPGEEFCGNSVCELTESWKNCCTDCGCIITGQKCSEESHRCYTPDAKISDDKAETLFKKTLEEQYGSKTDINAFDYHITSVIVDGKPTKKVCYYEFRKPYIKGGCSYVFDDGTVGEMAVFT